MDRSTDIISTRVIKQIYVLFFFLVTMICTNWKPISILISNFPKFESIRLVLVRVRRYHSLQKESAGSFSETADNVVAFGYSSSFCGAHPNELKLQVSRSEVTLLHFYRTKSKKNYNKNLTCHLATNWPKKMPNVISESPDHKTIVV